MSDNGERYKQILLTDSLIVAAVPVLGYYAAYFYLEQQAWTLGIPDSLVSVSFDFVLKVGVGVGIALLILLIIMLAMVAKNRDIFGDTISRAIWIDLLATPGCVALGVLASWSWYYIGLVLLAVGVFSLVQLGSVRVSVGLKQKKSVAEIKASVAGLIDTPMDKRVGIPVLFLMIVAFDICVGAKAIGKINAEGQTWYWVEAANRKHVLLAKYGDDLIFKDGRSGAISVKVLGKDTIPPLVAAKVGQMNVN
jgi:hypothetical protein